MPVCSHTGALNGMDQEEYDAMDHLQLAGWLEFWSRMGQDPTTIARVRDFYRAAEKVKEMPWVTGKTLRLATPETLRSQVRSDVIVRIECERSNQM